MSEQLPNSGEDLYESDAGVDDILGTIRNILSETTPVEPEASADVPGVSDLEIFVETAGSNRGRVDLDRDAVPAGPQDDFIINEAENELPLFVPTPAVEGEDLDLVKTLMVGLLDNPEDAEIQYDPEARLAVQNRNASLLNTPQTRIIQETSMPLKAVKKDAILDEVTETSTAGAFAELSQAVEEKAVFSERGPRIGDLVQDALRPMLKDWLDANLKGIVERAVTKEVKRISSGK